MAEHRQALLVHCYRMLGSIQDAEDALQDALLGAWRGLPGFEGRSSLRAWLYSIATNACLKMIERRGRRMLPQEYGPAQTSGTRPAEPLVESVWIDPFPVAALPADEPGARYEQLEAVELAFIAALQHLPARQRAVLILRDVLGFSGAEVAGVLETTPASVSSMLQRAHATVDQRLAGESQQATVRSLGDARLARLIKSYMDAWARSDVDAIVGMLTDDAVLAMPPRPTWFRGRPAIASFLREWPLTPGAAWRLEPVAASGQVAFATHRRAADGTFRVHAIDVLSIERGRISSITAFMDPAVLLRFGAGGDR